nr:DNA-binding protein [Oscillospiraceae bacterium]
MTDRACLAFDTSNYTTSVCAFDGETADAHARLLPVGEGELGLRQSDAVFHHTRALPELVEQLGSLAPCAVGASDRPREAEGSYMPCFLVGTAAARSAASLFGVPFLPFTHQQGHVAAAAWSAGRPELLDAPLMAWHLSGGTTELLLVRPDGRGGVSCSRIGGTKDISAGQLLDRTGKRLGVAFPAGKALDDAADPGCGETFRVRADGLEFSLSGMENKLADMIGRGAGMCSAASCALNTVSRAVLSATENALKQYGDLPVLFSGGVSGSSILRGHI